MAGTTSTGRGQVLNSRPPWNPYRDFGAALRPRQDVAGTAGSDIVNDYWWGSDIAGPPTAIPIPICWLTGDVALRLNQPFTVAVIGQTGGVEARASSASAVSEYGTFPATATLATPNSDDAQNLANWIVTYQSTPLMRSPSLTIDLLYRSMSEIATLLTIRRFSRVRLTGVPAEFPQGASSLIVRGVTHERGIRVRRMTITTGPVIGSTAGTPGPWFRIDSSLIDGTDVVPF